jgi:hypothetical protein
LQHGNGFVGHSLSLKKARRYVANQGGSLYAGMADMILKNIFKSGSLSSGKVAHFAPESLAQFGPESVAQFSPE